MCHVTLEPDIVMVWTPLPQHWPPAIIDLQMSDNHCHVHAVIVKLALTPHRAGWLRRQFTIFKTSKKETCVWEGHRLVVHWHCRHRNTCDSHFFNFHTSRDSLDLWIARSVHPLALDSGLHRVSDVTIMQYCHIGSDASSSQPTRRNEKDNQSFFWRLICCRIHNKYVDVDSDLTKEVGRADQIVSIHV